MKCVDEIKESYNLMADEQSKYIYKNRVMYNLFEEKEYIRNVIMTNSVAADFLKNLLSIKEPVAVWGAGIRAEKFQEFYPEVEIACYIDTKKCGSTLKDIPILSYAEFVNQYSDTKIVILPRFSHNEILKEIKSRGEISEERILDFASIMDQLYEEQYFDLPELQMKETGNFIDGGSFDGNDTIKFVKKYGKDRQVQIWEPNKNVIPQIKQKMKENGILYELIEAGMGSEKEFVSFVNKVDEPSAFRLDDIKQDENVCLVDCIDNHMKSDIAMIKMDIEGMEYKALLGAKKAIQKWKPTLAICVYHKQEDIWEIPKLIHEICPEYRFYLKHYSLFSNETVLFAVHI